jgi:hypothetical protein
MGRASSATAAQFARLLASQAASGSFIVSPDTGDASDSGAQDESKQSHGDENPGVDPPGASPLSEPATPATPARLLAQEPAAPAVAAASARISVLGAVRAHGMANAKANEKATGNAKPAPTSRPRPEHDTQLGKQIVQACTAAAHGDLLTRELADRIARFCAMSGAGGDASWAVTLPMNPAVLPDTLLHLQLSPSSIAIRFATPNVRSQQLISDNADALRVRLADALGRHIDVDVAASSV